MSDTLPYIYTYTYICIYIYIYKYTYIYMYVYVYVRMCLLMVRYKPITSERLYGALIDRKQTDRSLKQPSQYAPRQPSGREWRAARWNPQLEWAHTTCIRSSAITQATAAAAESWAKGEATANLTERVLARGKRCNAHNRKP